MTDRELLEAAAKAAGMEVKFDRSTGWVRARDIGSGDAFPVWNPLTSDSDAFRLAVKLRIRVDPVYEWCGPWNPSGTLKDPYGATRRYIVCAAAALQSSKG